MKCLRCQHENASGQKFCGECGARLFASCPACGASNSAEQKFCGECGARLGEGADPSKFGSPRAYTPKHLAERILLSKAALEGERKQVTVLFADLKGSMELLADRDPEEARKLLDPVLEYMMEAVHRYEGTVNQVMGDGIMALFGAPLALEDHAVRACYAALAMQSAIHSYGEQVQRTHALAIWIRVGLNSGEVVVRAIGSDLHMDYSAIGETTHLAARMEQMAKPGTVLITGETLKLVEGYVQVRSLGPVSVKGLAETSEVFELTGASAARTRLQAATARGLTRFVGRRRELEVLAEALDQGGRSKGQVVAIVGEPGVGKSRLFYEFIHSHRTRDWLVVEASSVSYGKATPYLPVIDLLKSYFKIADRDDARGIREKVTGKLLTLDRSLEPLLPPLLALLDQPVEDPHWQRLDPPQRRRQTLDALKRLWLREAQAQPLILVFEDLHWIDSETQGFLDGLLESTPTASVLVLFNYRPEYHHPWGSKTYYTQLRLDPLTGETAEDLLRTLLGSNPELQSLKKLLVERTEGNPFFLEESVRTLVESAALAGERGNYRLSRPLASIEVPVTVQAILSARIDRLSAEDKRLLQTAAVVGKDVRYALLARIAELDEGDLRDGLSRLQAAEFVYEASLFPDLEYTFKHALTHDVAYASLLQERRRALHARIVEAIESLYADRLDEYAEQLAHHARHAEAWEKALGYLRQAARKASARWAFREAARYLELALDVVERLPKHDRAAETEIDVRLGLRSALGPSARYQQIAEVVRPAVALAKSIGDRKRLAWAEMFQAHASIELCDVPQALQSSHRALALAEQIGEPALISTARHYISQVHHTLGNYRQTIDSGRPALELDHDAVVTAVASGITGAIPSYALTASEAEIGLFAQAAADGEVSMCLVMAAGHPYATALVHTGIGYAHLRRGDASSGIPLLEHSLRLCRTYDLAVWVPWTASALGLAYAFVGRHDEAIAHTEEGVKRGHALCLTRYQALRVTFLANVYVLAERRDDAHVAAGQALELARRYHERGSEAWALYLFAESADISSTDRAETAHQDYLSALHQSETLGMRPLSAHCHLGLGQLRTALGDVAGAREHLSVALATYRELGMHHWPEQAELALRALS